MQRILFCPPTTASSYRVYTVRPEQDCFTNMQGKRHQWGLFFLSVLPIIGSSNSVIFVTNVSGSQISILFQNTGFQHIQNSTLSAYFIYAKLAMLYSSDFSWTISATKTFRNHPRCLDGEHRSKHFVRKSKNITARNRSEMCSNKLPLCFHMKNLMLSMDDQFCTLQKLSSFLASKCFL